MSKIKTLLVIGVLISFFASLCELVFVGELVFTKNSNIANLDSKNTQNIESNLQDSINNPNIFFYISLFGQGIFLFGLFLLDRKAKSILSGYYASIVCICVILYCLPKSQENVLSILLITLFFFFLLYRYLHIWTKISGISLFIYSFYTLVACIICGIAVLKFNLVEARALGSFVVVFMIAPALIMYFSAIFSLKSITFNNLNKVIMW